MRFVPASSTFRLAAPAALALSCVVWLAGCSGSCPLLSSGCIDLRCGKVAATAGGTAWVQLDRDAITRVRGEERLRVPLKSLPCVRDAADILLVSPDGKRVLVYGTRGNIDFDFWGHAGRHVSVACMVDLDARAARPLDEVLDKTPGRRAKAAWGASGNIYFWEEGPPVASITAARPGGGTTRLEAWKDLRIALNGCTLTDDGKRLTFACVTHSITGDRKSYDPEDQRIEVVRYDIAVWPPVETERRRVALPAYGSPSNLALSPDGRLAAHVAHLDVKVPEYSIDHPRRNLVGVVDLDAERELFRHDTTSTAALTHAVAFDARGGLYVGDTVEVERHSPYGIVRRLDPSGRVLAEKKLKSAWGEIVRLADGSMLVVNGCAAWRIKL